MNFLYNILFYITAVDIGFPDLTILQVITWLLLFIISFGITYYIIKKGGEKWYKTFLPFYNIYLLLKIVYKKKKVLIIPTIILSLMLLVLNIMILQLSLISIIYFMFYLSDTYIYIIPSAVNLTVPENYISFISQSYNLLKYGSLILNVLFLIGLWKIFIKAGEKGYKAIIPFYNLYILFKIAFKDGSIAFSLLIPVIWIGMIFVVNYKLARSFGKSKLFSILTSLLPPLFYLIIGFDKSNYILNE